MMMTNYKIYFSSSFEDFAKEKRQIFDVIRQIGCVPLPDESTTANYWNLDSFKNLISQADIFVAVIGESYGPINEKGFSYLEEEYQHAASLNMPILVFFSNRTGFLEPHQKFDIFRANVFGSRMVEFFRHPSELTNKVIVRLFHLMRRFPELASQEIYNDVLLEEKTLIIIPDFEKINLELIEYFSKHPEDLEKMHHRKFELLLGEIFKNQGYSTEVGRGYNDGGIDLRLIHKDSIGSILTLVQAKRYKSDIPIKLEAVQALTALVDSEKANRGLFVTTSRYLPGVENWASSQPTKIILAKPVDIAKWCAEVVTKHYL